MKRSAIFSLALFALFAGSTAATAYAYTDNMLPNAIPEGWERAPYKIICNVEVEGKKVHSHIYRSYTDQITYPAWQVLMEGRDEANLWIWVKSAASEMAPSETRVYKHLKSGGWSETAPNLLNFSDAEIEALGKCLSK